ncbi:MAG TPA: hypothetical protein VJA18_07150 [Candidatus Nanoarchaeia archaeon]|nr:hypothetical protein [Candidatus Nanoarchaeia archaeon]
MKDINDIKEALKQAYSERKYFFFSGLFSLSVFSLNVLIGNYKLIASEFSLKLVIGLLISAHSTMSGASTLFLVIVSALSGIVFSLSLFLVRRQLSYSAGIGVSGIIASVLTPACSSCALGLAGILGIGSFLSVLPFKGLEFGFLGVILLGVSLVFLSRKIVSDVCEVRK